MEMNNAQMAFLAAGFGSRRDQCGTVRRARGHGICAAQPLVMRKYDAKKLGRDAYEVPESAGSDFRLGRVKAPRKGVVGAKKANTREQGRLVRGMPEKKLNVLRVFGGTAKGRKIISPEVYHRPMMGKVREALFSIVSLFLEKLVESFCNLNEAMTNFVLYCFLIQLFSCMNLMFSSLIVQLWIFIRVVVPFVLRRCRVEWARLVLWISVKRRAEPSKKTWSDVSLKIVLRPFAHLSRKFLKPLQISV